MRKLIFQLIKFAIVGATAMVIDLGVLVFLKEIIHVSVLIASAISFSVSVTANYILSMLFVFKSKDDNKIREFIVFVALSIGGLFLNQFIMWIGTEVMAFYYILVKVISAFFVSAYNFITRKIFLEKNT